MDLTITAQKNEGTTRLLVAGEADVSCADRLRAELDAALAAQPTELVVDLSELSYIDSTGIGALVATAHRAADTGIAFSVANPQRNVARVLSLLGVDGDLHVR